MSAKYDSDVYFMTSGPNPVADGSDLHSMASGPNFGFWCLLQVVQVYISWHHVQTVSMPRRQLVDFRRVSLEVNKPQRLEFKVTRPNMMLWMNKHVGYEVPKGKRNKSNCLSTF